MGFKVGIDVGGTFTDFLLVDDDGQFSIYKNLTTPSDPSVGVFEGLQHMARDLALGFYEFMHSIDIVVHGTTVTTNAVLTRNGARTALVTTEGFRDALAMRRGIREAQYDNHYTAPIALVPRKLRFGIAERVGADGAVLQEYEESELERLRTTFLENGLEAVAICLLNSYANPKNENDVAKWLRAHLPNLYFSVSCELSPSIRFYDRTSTTTLNAYVGPILSAYLQKLTRRLEEIDFTGILLIMQSNGGVTSPENASERAAVTLLSGPAAGPVAGMTYADEEGVKDSITIDMGGTSFDVALVKERTPVIVTEGEISRFRCAMPMVAIHTIGAGGGSIASVDEMGLLRMGPQSAGADPGPACYGRGGERAACTDADVLLGYLNPDYFLGGAMRLDASAARQAITAGVARPLGVSPTQAAAGMYQIINAHMADGIREVSVKRGYDPREFLLVVAGGAGPVHAGMIAHELGMRTVLIPRESSVFCATGMLLSDLKHDYVQSNTVLVSSADPSGLKGVHASALGMKGQGQSQLIREGISAERIQHLVSLDLRYEGQYHELNVPVELVDLETENAPEIVARFSSLHDRTYGYSLQQDWEQGMVRVQVVNVRCSCVGVTIKPQMQHRSVIDGGKAARKGVRAVYNPFARTYEEASVWDGHALGGGHEIEGLAIVELTTTTIVVPPGYVLTCNNNFVMRAA